MSYRHALPAALIICLAGTLASAQDQPTKRTPLTLALSATIAPAPAQVTARIKVEPDPRSRSLTVEWWSEEGAGGSHAVGLDGERAAARQDFAIKRIDEGRYVVRAIVTRDDGSIVKREATLIVIGAGASPGDAGGAAGDRR